MKMLKVYTDFAEDLEPLSEAEVGRLFKAMLQYASIETVPDLKGNERFLWATAKKNIDRQKESYDSMCATNKRIATERNGALRSVTERNGALQDKDKDKDKDKEKKKRVLIAPTVEEVSAYCAERGNGIDPKHFVDYYAANDWTKKDGTPVTNWKQAVITWENTEKKNERVHRSPAQSASKWNLNSI